MHVCILHSLPFGAQTCCVPASAIFCVHSSWLFSVTFPGGVHAASPLTSSSNAHDDELGCHRLAAGGGFGRPARYFVHYIYSEDLRQQQT